MNYLLSNFLKRSTIVNPNNKSNLTIQQKINAEKILSKKLKIHK